IVKQSGGAIRVDSEAGGGSTFTIYLGRVDDPIALVEPKGQATEAPRGSETILVVEDEDAVREVVCRTLRINGYTLLQARHGSDEGFGTRSMRERPRLRVPPDGSLALVEPERLLPEALAGLVKADPEGGGVLELPAELARADRLVAARADLRRARDEADARGI